MDLDKIAVTIIADNLESDRDDDERMKRAIDEAWRISYHKQLSFCDLVSAIGRAFIKRDND